MEDLVAQWHPEQRYLARCSSEIGEQAEEILGIQLPTIERAGYIDSS